MARLAALHDAAARGLFALACAALAAAAGLYVFEVAARYLFDAPTTWSGEAVRYSLAILIFAALPEITRRGAHIAVEIVPDALPPRLARALGRFNAALGGAVCAFAAWIAAGEAARQFGAGVMTNAAHPIPRWGLTAVIALGLAGAASFFLRETFASRRA